MDSEFLRDGYLQKHPAREIVSTAHRLRPAALMPVLDGSENAVNRSNASAATNRH